MVLNRFREQLNGVLEGTAKSFLWLEPYQISGLGVIFVSMAAYAYYLTSLNKLYVWYGTLLFLISSLMDALDGAVARLKGKTSPLGSFTDSLTDRVVEVILILGLILGKMATMIPGSLFLATALIISYSRAKAESLGVKMAGVGLMERAERIILLLIGIILWSFDSRLLDYALLVSTVLNILTIIQRVVHVSKRLR